MNQCPDVVFYRCRSCNNLFPVAGGQALLEKKVLCCNEEAERLASTDTQGVRELSELSYQTTGGYNDNTAKVSWKTKRQECVPQWIYLKILTGGYLKYVMKEEHFPMVFALVNADTFCYCDEGPCLKCMFHCERGFAVYVYSEGTGLLGMPLDRTTAHWRTREREAEK